VSLLARGNPNEIMEMYFSTAVVDVNNTSGLGPDGKAPLIVMYTSVVGSASVIFSYLNKRNADLILCPVPSGTGLVERKVGQGKQQSQSIAYKA
jgi:hypothetical protein